MDLDPVLLGPAAVCFRGDVSHHLPELHHRAVGIHRNPAAALADYRLGSSASQWVFRGKVREGEGHY
jgi:hypothetical protein